MSNDVAKPDTNAPLQLRGANTNGPPDRNAPRSAQFCPVTFPARGAARGRFEERGKSMDSLPELKAGIARDPARWQRLHPISGLIGSDAGVTPMWGRACLPADLTGWLKGDHFFYRQQNDVPVMA
jgi:hypothetical protein